MDGWMSKQMNKQIDKHMNKRLVLKKGQIAILEALYGGRFGRCWLFWVGVAKPYKPNFNKTKKTVALFVCRSVAVEGLVWPLY